MTLFKPAENKAAYLKAAFMGLAGSGKTYTASSLAIGMVRHMQKLGLEQGKRPVYFVDSENGASWMVARFQEAGIPLQVASTTAFADLAQAMAVAREQASVLIIDSITAFWVEFTETYKEAKGRKRGLEFQDWGWLKNEWRKKFTVRFLNDPLHTIMCGRMGFEYEHYVDDAGKKQIEKTGVKLKAESELGFEPSLLVQMEREQDIDSHEIHHIAHVLKDRRADGKSLDGKSFKDPTFASFLPHVEYLNLGGAQGGFDEAATSAMLIPDDPARDHYGTRREIVVEELDALLLEHGFGGQSAESKQKRMELVKKHFKCVSRTEIEKLMPLDDLRASFDSLHVELTGKPSRYGSAKVDAPIDVIPHTEPDKQPDAPAAQAAEAPVETSPATGQEAGQPNDLDTIIRDFEAEMAKAQSTRKVNSVWQQHEQTFAGMDEGRQGRMLLAQRKAMTRVQLAKAAAAPANLQAAE